MKFAPKISKTLWNDHLVVNSVYKRKTVHREQIKWNAENWNWWNYLFHFVGKKGKTNWSELQVI